MLPTGGRYAYHSGRVHNRLARSTRLLTTPWGVDGPPPALRGAPFNPTPTPERSLSPQAVYDSAVNYIAVSMLCIGAPNRDQLARAYANDPIDGDTTGILVQRINQQAAYDHFVGNGNFSQPEDRGAWVPFLIEPEIIPPTAIAEMKKVVESLIPKPDRDQWHSRIGPVGYVVLRTSAGFPLPHQIASGLLDGETKGWFQKLEAYAGHPFHAKNFYFASPTFSSGQGDAGAAQTLTLFETGGSVHQFYDGKNYSHPGIFRPAESKLDFRTPEVPITSPVSLHSYHSTKIIVPISPGDKYIASDGQEITFNGHKPWFVICTAHNPPEDALASGGASLRDPRLELAIAQSRDFQGHIFYDSGDSITLVRSDYRPHILGPRQPLEAGHPFEKSRTILKANSPTPVTRVMADTVLVNNWGPVAFAPRGTIVTQSFDIFPEASPASEGKKVILLVDGQPPRLVEREQIVACVA